MKFYNYLNENISTEDFINIVKNLCTSNEKDYLPTLSTILMEYNGYNGVNVNNIEGWDNTLHGSVIYDLSKTITPNYDYTNKTYNNKLFNTKLKNNKIVSNYDTENKFYKKITPNTTLKQINYYINELDKPLEKFDWIMIDELWKEDKISKEVYEHIPKVYSFKIKKLVDNGLRVNELNGYDLKSLLRIVDYNYISQKIDIEDLLYTIYKTQIYYSPIIQKFIKSINKNDIQDDSWYYEIVRNIS